MVQGHANPNSSFLPTRCLIGVGRRWGLKGYGEKLKGNFLEIKGTLKGGKQLANPSAGDHVNKIPWEAQENPKSGGRNLASWFFLGTRFPGDVEVLKEVRETWGMCFSPSHLHLVQERVKEI